MQQKKYIGSTDTVKRDRRIEKAIKNEDSNFISSLKTEKEARRVSDYLKDRLGELNGKIKSLGSAEKLRQKPKLYNERKKVLKLSNEARDKVSSFVDRNNNYDPSEARKRTTTTYERARKRRIKNFDSWYFGRR